MIHVLSLGAGVQSSTMALMAALGEIEPMPELAIFANTGWEPAAVYQWLEWLEAQLPFPVVRVSKGNIREDLLHSEMRNAKRWVSPPLFTLSAEGDRGMVPRQCTTEYKLQPIFRHLREEVLGLRPRQRAPKEPVITQWIGISADEASRMKPARDRWITNRYPLAMEHRMNRADCIAWMTRQGYPMPPRSACIGCPFRSNAEWRTLTDAEFEDACQVDEALRGEGALGNGRAWADGAKQMNDRCYLHADRIPLRLVDLDSPEDRGQLGLWGEECEGMCGV